MGFIWTEIKKWAKSNNLEPKKTGSEYIFEEKTYKDLDSLVTTLFNKITENKWVEHQNNYEKNSRENRRGY